jgi:hypothetical protein
MAIINRFSVNSGTGVRTALAATNYTIAANERLLVTDITGEIAIALTARIWFVNRTTGVDLHSLYIPVGASIQRPFIIPIEITGPAIVGLDELTVAPTPSLTIGWNGTNES